MITLRDAQDQMREQAIVAEKRLKREREDQAARAAREREEPLTAAHVLGEAMMDSAPSGPAEKAIADRGATAGPGEGMPPGRIEPEDFRRPYVSEGHAARSPMAEAPRTPPLPPGERGVLSPLGAPVMPRVSGHSGPALQGIAQHYASAARSAPPAQATKGSTR